MIGLGMAGTIAVRLAARGPVIVAELRAIGLAVGLGGLRLLRRLGPLLLRPGPAVAVFYAALVPRIGLTGALGHGGHRQQNQRGGG
jgi:hypothetical protein